jgi:serine/threonine protein kinase
MPDNVGRIIAGRYFLEQPIGRGGMGIVWRAHDQVLHREVAVKEVTAPAAMGEDESAAYQRTLREAQTVARLNHPNIVTVHDVAEENGRLWIVMELIPSGSLEEQIAAHGPMTTLRAARLGQQLLSALAAVHAAGVLHRDVKPSNVLIAAGDPGDGPGDRSVLTDFGIAQSEGDTRITQANVVMGSAGYTAPERLTGQDATPASDLWSLGATLYAAVEGHGPYQRDTMSSMLAATMFAAPPPAASAGRLAPLIEALLRRDPSTRPSAAVAARILAEILRRMPDETAPASLVAANWLDLTPAESALQEIAEPTEWAEPEQYDTPLPAPPQERTQTSSIPPLFSPVQPNPPIYEPTAAPSNGSQTARDLFQQLVSETGRDSPRSARRVRAAGSARRAGNAVRAAVAVLVIAGIGVGGFFLLKSRLIHDAPSNSAATRSLPPATSTTGSPSPSTTGPPVTPGAAVVEAIDMPTDGVPRGYKPEKIGPSAAGKTGGFGIDIPQSWQATDMGQNTYQYSPDGISYVDVDLTRDTMSNMVAEAHFLETEERAQYSDYRPIYSSPGKPRKSYILEEGIRGTTGALWQFDYVKNNVTWRMDVLVFTLNQQSYTIYMSAPAGAHDSHWNGAVLPMVYKMLRTFTPIPA